MFYYYRYLSFPVGLEVRVSSLEIYLPYLDNLHFGSTNPIAEPHLMRNSLGGLILISELARLAWHGSWSYIGQDVYNHTKNKSTTGGHVFLRLNYFGTTRWTLRNLATDTNRTACYLSRLAHNAFLVIINLAILPGMTRVQLLSDCIQHPRYSPDQIYYLPQQYEGVGILTKQTHPARLQEQ